MQATVDALSAIHFAERNRFLLETVRGLSNALLCLAR